jgi:S-adenosylmethionine synthetase
MSLEAAAGKNPVTHVGKIYFHLGTRYCEQACVRGVRDRQGPVPNG